MRWIPIAFFAGTLWSCTGENTRIRSALDAMTREQRQLSAQVEILTRRLTVLETRLAAREGRPGSGESRQRSPSSTVAQREPGPDELPTVTLRPRETVRLAPSPRAPVPVDEDGFAEEEEPRERPVQDDPPPPPNARRVVLKLEGTPPPSVPDAKDAAPDTKPLPLGKFVPLRDPDETASDPVAEPPSRPAAPPAATKAAMGADALYRAAMEQYEGGQYALALTLFARLEKEHPSHTLAANAVFWQGECHFQMGKFELAAALFQRVVDKHPRSPKVPDALYKLGVSLDKNGQSARAREILARVMELVPQTPLAAKAAAYLQKMR